VANARKAQRTRGRRSREQEGAAIATQFCLPLISLFILKIALPSLSLNLFLHSKTQLRLNRNQKNPVSCILYPASFFTSSDLIPN